MNLFHNVLRYIYAPLFFAGFVISALVIWIATAMPILLGVLLCIAIGVSLFVERVVPYERAFNSSHHDSKRDILHALVNESINVISLLIFPFVVTLFPTTGIWPSEWPILAQLGIAILVADFGITLTHYVSHKYAILWRFHAVHHSVQRLYGFNGLMKHPVHQLIELTSAAIPLMILGMPQQIAWLLAFAVAIQLLLQHSNVDMRMGFLGYFWAVAPVHRFHHVNISGEGDVNFGLFTTCWDHLLGTYRRFPARGFVRGDFGIAGEPDYPKSYFEQIREPFR